MDLIIFMAILGAVVFYLKGLNNIIFSIGVIDIFLRIVDWFKPKLGSGEIYHFLTKYFPSNLLALCDKYTNGVVFDILTWVYVIIYIIFEAYLIKAMFNH